MDINAVDNIGSTPLHEAVNQSREAAVQMLLDYRALPTLDRYITVTPVKKQSGSVGSERAPKGGVVNLLARGGAGVQFNPLQDAVENGHINIVRMILGRLIIKIMFNLGCAKLCFIYFSSEKVVSSSAEFPSLDEIVKSKTSDNRSLLDLCQENSPMYHLILDYTHHAGKVPAATMSSRISLKDDGGLFALLVENSLVKYMSCLCLPQVYRVWKTSRTEPGYSPHQLKRRREEWKPIQLPQVKSL